LTFEDLNWPLEVLGRSVAASSPKWDPLWRPDGDGARALASMVGSVTGRDVWREGMGID
jgi:hypothetical protein